MTTARPTTIAGVRLRSARALYPCDYLDGHTDAIALFASAFYGANDLIHLFDANLTVACVDVDEARTNAIARMYPAHWTFHTAEAFHWARTWAHAGRTADIVTLDPFTNLFDDVAAEMPLWCQLARRVVIVGCDTASAAHATRRLPAGWKPAAVHPRSTRASWAVFTRDWMETT